MLIKLIEIYNLGSAPKVREVYLNPSNIVYIREEMNQATLKEVLDLGFAEISKFSTIHINEGGNTRVITVAHSPQEIHKKVNTSKTLLKG